MSTPQTNQHVALLRQFVVYAAVAAGLAWLLTIGVEGVYADLTSPVFPVSGTVLVEGRAPVGAVVKFHRVDAKQWVVTTPIAKVNDDGRFQLRSIGNRSGAPAGEYIVTVEWTPEQIGVEGLEASPNLLPARYATAATSPLRATVRAETNELATIDLSCRCAEALASK